ncbi:hypothetical protein A1O7_02152 [Cladophialophora yegresii CBS 114405]|uniref:Uncharacterized protein n=1 Tax=Cladophialophora yegresii CBS 114405 TaxID=1182544 RepID=W9W184_9EURO|nr:uncharacterized protein A1O7_02152 [Cladophialophora yegresii CBS 114405]EXJ61723.1 hypothetical protein A1O7_02152 [Cladophialophora yegresii CBS 114405]
MQDHVIYLHRVTSSWFKDVKVPEYRGFLGKQVTPFQLERPYWETLHARHILPLGAYRGNEKALRDEPAAPCHKFRADLTSTSSRTTQQLGW